MASIQCFLLEETGRMSVKLRRYVWREKTCAVGKTGYHEASIHIEDEPVEADEQGIATNNLKPVLAHDDPRWPKACQWCGYVFQEEDGWQRFAERLYRRTDTGEEILLRDAPVGAMWYSWWLDHMYKPQGEHNLSVMTDGGEWVIDSQSSNCTMPDDQRQEKHHCWIRHGEAPNITVDNLGVTCGAGGGSIQCNNYHGFLRNGFLVD